MSAVKPVSFEAIYCNWKAKFGGMEVPEVKRLKSLEEENARLKSCLPKPCWTGRHFSWLWGEILTIDQKREAVSLCVYATGLSQSRACRLTGLIDR